MTPMVGAITLTGRRWCPEENFGSQSLENIANKSYDKSSGNKDVYDNAGSAACAMFEEVGWNPDRCG